MARDSERFWFVVALGAVGWLFSQQALRLQRTETDRRLAELNNEAGRLKDLADSNVSHDTWAAFTETYERRHKQLGDDIVRLGVFQGKLLGAFVLASFIIPLLITLLTYYLGHR